MRRFSFACALLLAVPAWGLDVSSPHWYVCESGDCANGAGKARAVASGVLFSGTWRGGKSIAGQTYTLSHPARPDQTYQAVYDAQGLQVSGNMLFGLGVTGRNLPTYTGTYAHIDHPFAQFKIAVPRQGVLDTARGYRMQGRFEYLPSKDTLQSRMVSGTYIFFGTVTDVDDDSVETGLFLSNAQPNGMVPTFHKANAAYLANLQKKYQQDLAVGKAMIAEEESSRRWREVLGVVGRLTMALTTGDVSSAVKGLAAETAMNVVSNALKGDDTQLTAEDATNQAIGQLAAGDDGAAQELRGLISR